MIARLSRREQIVVTVGGAAALLIVLVAGVILPYRSAIQRLDERIAARRTQIVEARQLAERIKAMQTEAAIAERRLSPAQPLVLVPTLEALVTRVAGRDRLIATRPQPATPPAGFRQERVEVQLEKLRLDQLVRLLNAVDTADAALQTDALKVRPRYEDPALLDVTLSVSAFTRGG